jgi:hypothetical protein
MTMIIDNAYHVVFNPTTDDWANSNETAETAQKDTLEKRWWLTLTKEAEAAKYNYAGTDQYTNGPIADIPAVYMTPEELAVLAATWRYTPLSFDLAKTITDFSESENNFKKCFLYTLEFAMLQNSSTPANIAAAHTSLANTLTALDNLDFDNCYLQLSSASVTTSFTQTTKDDMIKLIGDYLKKYPR